jgi:uncharacterized protein (TIGR03083 family)
MQPVRAIATAHLFPEIRQLLLELLADLSPREWDLPTIAGQWSVKDVALHILGGDLGNLARRRDQHSIPSGPLDNYSDLVAFINRINQQWVEASRRLSTRLIIDLLDHSGREADAYFMSLDPNALGTSVSWAGPGPAPNWLDVAREYTERWHHQQQIRDAANRPGLYSPHIFAPILDTFVRALPRTFSTIDAPSGTTVQLTIPGAAGAYWLVHRAEDRWELFTGRATNLAAEVTIQPEIAWKIFTRGIRDPKPGVHATIAGDPRLANAVLGTVSVIA